MVGVVERPGSVGASRRAEASTGEQAIQLFRAHQPDVTLMDLRLSCRVERNRTPDARDYEFEEDDVPFVYRRTEPEFPTVTSASGTTPGDSRRQFLEELRIHREHERVADAVASFDLTRQLARTRVAGGQAAFGHHRNH